MKIDRWINTREELIAYKVEKGLRDDWHEPDEQGIDCFFRNAKFDNAFGDDGEMHVIIYNEETCESFGINMANLLAWASGYRG